MLQPALAAAEEIDATVANMRFVKPLDSEMVRHLARTHEALVTVEEGCVMGGAGAPWSKRCSQAEGSGPVLQLGLPDGFIDHGDPAMLLAACGLDARWHRQVDSRTLSVERCGCRSVFGETRRVIAFTHRCAAVL